jgi:hypothetical protein
MPRPQPSTVASFVGVRTLLDDFWADVGTLVDLGILEIDDRQCVFVQCDEIDLRVPLAA